MMKDLSGCQHWLRHRKFAIMMVTVMILATMVENLSCSSLLIETKKVSKGWTSPHLRILHHCRQENLNCHCHHHPPHCPGVNAILVILILITVFDQT